MKISVIIPVYNVENYLIQCLNSVLNQTFKEFELILVDDGSMDSSGSICDEYVKKDNRVTVLHSVNGGQSMARNLGLSVSNGDYITFIDSDDFIHSQYLEILFYFAEKYKADLVTASYECDCESRFDFNLLLSEIKESLFNGQKDFDAILCMGNVVPWGKLYKRTLFENFKYPEGKLHEDEYIHKILYECKNVVCIPAKLYFYRRRLGSTMYVFKKERVYWALEAFEDRIRFAQDKNWNELFISALKRYADYCVDEYYIVQKQEDGIDRTDLLIMLQNSLRGKIKEFGKNRFDKKYVLFAKNIALYESYIKMKHYKDFIHDRLCSVLRKIVKH